MKFRPLRNANWINNAIIKVSDNFNLSVSYNKSPGMWFVGKKEAYEVAIQVGKPDSKYKSLVSLPNNSAGNVYHNCDSIKIKELITIASSLEYAAEIYIFDNRKWKHRFHCAKGFDQQEKEGYVRGIFGKNWKYIPAL